MMVHEARRYGVFVGKIGRLSFSFKFLHFDRIAGRMRQSRIRHEGITTIARPEFQPEAIADRKHCMHDAIVTDSPRSKDECDSDNSDKATEQLATADAVNFPKSRQKKKGKH